MRVPTVPPDEQQLWANVLKDADAFARIMGASDGALTQDYLHWDDVRRRPPPAGLSHELWWLTLKMKRKAARTTTPFKDTQGRVFWFCEPVPVRSALRNVDLHWGGAIAAPSAAGTPTAGEGRAYLMRSLAEEPFSSSFLEGAATTRDIAKELIFRDRRPRTRDERMVLNNYRAMQHVKQNLTEPLSVDLILEIHQIITEGTLDRPEMAGVFRSSSDGIRVFDEVSNDVLHTPPVAESLVERIGAICEFANDSESSSQFIHPAIRAVIVHFMMGYDHPFIDGNGRTARALFYWVMLKSGYWLAEYASISSVIKDAPIQYGRSFLETETDEADLTYFICNQCDAIAKSEIRLAEYMHKKRREVEGLAEVIEREKRDGGFNHRQTNLLNDLVRRRISKMNISVYQSTHAVSYHTARNDLEDLTKRGYLSKRRIGRDTIYAAAGGLEGKLLGDRRPTKGV
jgi:Fic family protein